MPSVKSVSVADNIIDLYKKHGGSEYAGEKITQLQHMVQAAGIATHGGYDDEIILAAFLHDIGHICVAANAGNTMNNFGIIDHEKIGSDFLGKHGFSERITRLVENHVSAKRYLTFKNAEYFNGLSEASKKTLEYQGGKMNAAEALSFEEDELFTDFIIMRHCDEMAKQEDYPVNETLDYFHKLIINHLEK